jgi:hypothetical protein
MHFYGLSDTAVLKMPIRRFWLLHKSIDRVAAENDIRGLKNLASAHGGEGFKEHLESLQRQLGEVVYITPDPEEITTEGVIDFSSLPNSRRDQAGFNALKAMGRSI